MNLTTLQRVKDYLAGVGIVAGTSADTLYAGLISRASDVVIQWTGRSFQRATYTDVRLNGSGSDTLMLPQNPIISISSLTVDGTVIAASADALATGYQYDNKFVYLFGGACFSRGLRNVKISFVAGFTTSQSSFIPASTPYTITPVTGSGLGPDGAPMSTSGPAITDRGVVRVSTGAAFVLVGSSPSTGQYSFSGGVYTFAAADQGVQVTMSYDFVPGAVEQATIELVGMKLKQRDNLGISSKALATETITYMDKDLSAAIKGMLQPYRGLVSP